MKDRHFGETNQIAPYTTSVAIDQSYVFLNTNLSACMGVSSYAGLIKL